MAQKKGSHRKGSNKTFAAKRTMNPPQGDGSHQGNTGSRNAFEQHDVRNRLGDYESAGNHARTGNRGHQ